MQIQTLKIADKQIGKIEIKEKGEEVLFYNLSDIIVSRKELKLPSGILVFEERKISSIYYGDHIEFSVIDIENTNNSSIVIISPDDRLIYRTKAFDWTAGGGTIVINEKILLTRCKQPDSEQDPNLITFDSTSNRAYYKKALPCLIDMSSTSYKEYTYIYRNSKYIVTAEHIDKKIGFIKVFDYNLNKLHQVAGHFDFGLIDNDTKSFFVVFNRAYKYYYLKINHEKSEGIDFLEEKIYGLSGIGRVEILVPVSFISNFILFQSDEKIAILSRHFEHISTFSIPSKYDVKNRYKYDSCGNIDLISRFVTINDRVFIECRHGYAGNCDNQYFDFMGNCVFSINEIGSDLCVIKKNIVASCKDESSALFGLCDMSLNNLIPIIYDEIKTFSMDGLIYIVAKQNLPNNSSLFYCYVVKATPTYDNYKTIKNYTYAVSTLIDGEYDIDIQIYTKYGNHSVLELTDVGYGYENCEDNSPIPYDNYLFSPFVECTRNDKKKKLICYNYFISDYQYDDVCQLYLSPGVVNYLAQRHQKTMLRNFIFVAKRNDKDVLLWGMIDIRGNTVIDIKYHKICNRNSWVIADNDIFIFRNNEFLFLKHISNGELIAWTDYYMAFELDDSSIMIIDIKANLRYQNNKEERIELSSNTYFDINNKYFVYVEEPNDMTDWDNGPSWEELGKDEEDYIINNGGDWILDNG